MTSDELKGLRLRRSQLQAELVRIEGLLAEAGEFEPKVTYHSQPYRNSDSNGNYVTPEDNNDSQD